jgi:hypothetical protein
MPRKGMQNGINTDNKQKEDDQRRWQIWTLLPVEVGRVGDMLVG